jgi:glycosyltransferase involved in cell wall biosynthesis
MALISVISPVYHNAASLGDLHEAFKALAGRNPDDAFEFILVDDDSGDNSYEVLLALAQDEPRMRVVKLSRNFGSMGAIQAGLAQSRGDAVAVITADLQDPPELIHDMLVHWRAGSKVIIAARSTRGDPFLTTALADSFYSLFRRFAIRSMPEHGFDFFVIDRQVCDLINGIEETNAYLMGLILWMGFHPVVVSYKRRERPAQYGRSMWSFLRRIKFFIDAFVAFSYTPVRAVSILGVGVSLVGLLYAILIITLRLLYDITIEGWSSLMVVVLVVSGVQMLMLGVLGEYMWRNLEETRRRPRFIVDRVVEGGARKTATHYKR